MSFAVLSTLAPVPTRSVQEFSQSEFPPMVSDAAQVELAQGQEVYQPEFIPPMVNGVAPTEYAHLQEVRATLPRVSPGFEHPLAIPSITIDVKQAYSHPRPHQHMVSFTLPQTFFVLFGLGLMSYRILRILYISEMFGPL